jgi:hypothetical protein
MISSLKSPMKVLAKVKNIESFGKNCAAPRAFLALLIYG